MKVSRLLSVLGLVVALHSVANAGIIFSRPFPTTQAAASKGAPDSQAMIFGDDFTLTQNSVINSLSVWVIGENPISTSPADELNVGIRLYGASQDDDTAPDSPGLTLLASNYTSFTRVYFEGGANYVVGEKNEPIFKITFSGLNWNVNAGTTYDFALKGLSDFGYLLNLGITNSDPNGDGASALFSGTPYRYLYQAGSWNGETFTAASDIAVELDGNNVPEPSTMALFALGGGILFFIRRKK
jgi:hypothetical protein